MNKLRTSSWKVKSAFIGLTLIGIVFIAIQTFIAIGTWFDQNQIVRHNVLSVKVEVNPPFTIEKRNLAIVSPLPTKTTQDALVPKAEASEPTVQQAKALPEYAEPAGLEDIVKDIWMLETTQGKAPSGHHITCRNKGMWNELGYGARSGFCFNNKEEGFARVSRWYTEKLNSYPLNQALCLYETGNPVDDCKYYQDYLSIQ